MSVSSFSLGISPASLCSFALIITMTRIRGSSLWFRVSNQASSERRQNRHARWNLEPELLREDLLHDLVAAAADRAQAGVAHRAADLLVPVGDPEGQLRHLERGALGQELRLRHLAERVPAVGEEPQGVVGEAARRLVLHGDLRDRVAPAALPARRLGNPFQHPLHGGHRAQRHHQPLPLEVGHDQVEAAVLLAEQVLLGHEHVAEGQFRSVGRPPAQLLELPRDLVALHLALEDEERQPVMSALLGRLHGGDDEVGAHAVRDVGLRPVDHVAAVNAPGEGAVAGHVGPGARLGDAERGDPLAADRGRQEARLLLVGAEPFDRRRGDAHVGADPGRHTARPAARQLLAQHGVVEMVAAAAAVLARVLEPEEAELAHPREHLVGEPALPLPLAGVRPELLGDEPPDLAAQRLVALGEGRGRGRCRRSFGGERAHSISTSSASQPYSGSSFSSAPPSAPSIERVMGPPRSSRSSASRKWTSATRGEPARAACSAALRTSSRRKAGLTPSVAVTIESRSASATSRPRPNRSSSRERDPLSGSGKATAWSTRPGRAASAGSSRSARFVVMTKITSASSPIPSISFRRRKSSEVAPKPIAVRSWATRSTSSRITIAGWRLRAMAQASATSPSAAPVRITTVLPSSLEIRYEVLSVLPVPGGPCRRRPRRRWRPAPRSVSAWRANSTVWSSITSSTPSGSTI